MNQCNDNETCHDCVLPNGDCICVQAGFCGELELCPDGDCPAGFFCCINTCCAEPVCLPLCTSGPEGGDWQLRQAQPGELTSSGIAR